MKEESLKSSTDTMPENAQPYNVVVVAKKTHATKCHICVLTEIFGLKSSEAWGCLDGLMSKGDAVVIRRTSLQDATQKAREANERWAAKGLCQYHTRGTKFVVCPS